MYTVDRRITPHVQIYETCLVRYIAGEMLSEPYAYHENYFMLLLYKSEMIMSVAAKYGHIDMMRWAHSVGSPLSGVSCRSAARAGQLEVLRSLPSNVDIPVDALDTALLNGHLDVAKWLRREAGTPWTMWCTSAAVGAAKHFGNFEVLQWCLDNGECSVADIKGEILAPGYSDIVSWLDARKK
jgi:hypothetical protein